MNNALLVTGGLAPPVSMLQKELQSASCVCAADSGFDTCLSWNLIPDIALGDMDSVEHSKELSQCREVLRFPRDKDYTDTELGINLLRERGFDTITVAGGGGGRADHIFALLYLFFRTQAPEQWITDKERILHLPRAMRFSVPLGACVSVFPGPYGSTGMSSKGLRWPLDGLVWKNSDFGISNVAVSEEIMIDPGKYPLIAVLPLETVIMRA